MTKAAQMDRDIAEALAGGGTYKQPLYGHTSEATAYIVDDYPYGSQRTQIRYWLEGPKPKKGWRFVSQTLNPKTNRWNKPKASTYSDWGGAMFLDEKGHVQWTGVGPYTDEAQFLAFVKTFPGADMSELRKVVPAKKKLLEDLISGKRFFSINGVRQPATEAENERRQQELAVWEEIGVIVDRM